MTDPTYVRSEIDANPTWHVAFVLSEIMNDQAPIGWGKYISVAGCLLDAFDMTPKAERLPTPSERVGGG